MFEKAALQSLAVAHGISMMDRKKSSDDLRESIACHVGLGQCNSSNRSYEGCDSVREALRIQFGDGLEDSIIAGKISFLSAVFPRTNRRTLERLLRANDIAFEKGSKTGHLRRVLKRHIKSLQKGKKKSNDCHHNEQLHVRRNWPQIPSLELKQQLVQMFRDETFIPMNEMYSKMRPGTLVLAVCEPHVYNIIQNSQPTSVSIISSHPHEILIMYNRPFNLPYRQ